MERMKTNTKRREGWLYAALGLCVFAFLFLFFAKLHPLMMHDGDDWGYSAYTRGALPVWGGWNPTRVLPEIVSPLFAYAASYLVMPFTGDLSWAMVIVYALFFSLLISVYVLLFVRFVKRRFGLAPGVSAALGVLFVLSHFLILRSASIGNVHMFYCWNVNTYFFYLLPDLLCASLALYLGAERGRSFAFDAGKPLRSGCFFVLLYLAIFSNLFSSYILAVFAGLMLLSRLCAALRRKGSLLCVLRENAWLVVVLILWLVCAAFELGGGRAESLETDASFVDRLRLVYGGLLDVIAQLNPLFVSVCLLMLLSGLAMFALSRGRHEADGAMGESVLLFACAFFLSACYLVLLCAKASPGYIVRPDVFFGAVFFMLLLVMSAAAYLLRRAGVLAFLLPMLCFVFYFELDTRWTTFKEPNVDNLPAVECAAINQALIHQMLDAQARGETSPLIEVPEGPYWYIADNMSNTLLKCGLLEREMYATNVTIDDFYDKYGIR